MAGSSSSVTMTITTTPIFNDEIICISNTWGVGGGGGREILSSAVVGTFPCSVEPQAKGTRGEGAPEGFDHNFERATNAITYQVHFAPPDMPSGGLQPWDTMLWLDALGTGHVLTVLGFWPLGSGSIFFVAKAIERT